MHFSFHSHTKTYENIDSLGPENVPDDFKIYKFKSIVSLENSITFWAILCE